MERAMGSGPRHPDSTDCEGLPPGGSQEVALRKEIEEHKKTYVSCMERLKQVKAEIEQYKHNNEINKQRLQKDFEAWYVALQASQGQGSETMAPVLLQNSS